jgi:hypothetical protein
MAYAKSDTEPRSYLNASEIFFENVMKISNLLILENNKLPVQNASIIFLLLFGL